MTELVLHEKLDLHAAPTSHVNVITSNIQKNITSDNHTSEKSSIMLCKVCSGTATGVHYGVMSCEGCKAFFKRAVSQYSQTKCYFGGSCLITPETRGRCKACRLQRCISEGMALDGTKFGRGRGMRNFRANAAQKPQVPLTGTSCMVTPYKSLGPVWLPAYEPVKSIALRPVMNVQSFMEPKVEQSTSRSVIVLQTSLISKQGGANRGSNSVPSENSILVRSFSNEPDNEAVSKSTNTVGEFLDKVMDREMLTYKRRLDQTKNQPRLSFASNYLALLADRNHRLQDTVGAVTGAVAFAYRAQIEDWTNFMERSLPELGSYPRKPDTSVENIIVGLQNSIMADVDKLTEFCRMLPGFSDLSRREQRYRISSKYTVTWLLNRAPYMRNRELFILMGHHHYGRYWMETLLDSDFVTVLFDFMEEVNSLNLTLTENYLLMAVIVLQPNLWDTENAQFVKFLHSHYLEALIHVFGSRCPGSVGRLKYIFMKAMTIDVLHSRYVTMLDFSKCPVRAINGIQYSPALLDIPSESADSTATGKQPS